MSRILFVCIAVPLLAAPARAAAPPDPVTTAIRRGLDRLEKGAASYTTKRQCFSCHHQTMTVGAFVSARERGYRISEKALKQQVAFTLGSFSNRLERVTRGESVGGANTTTAYALLTLRWAGHGADATTAALVDFLLVKQQADGSWPATTNRPPTEGSRFTTTALALEALAHYGAGKDIDAEKRKKIDAVTKKGKAWLLETEPKDTEDRVFHLWGLAVIDRERLAEARDELLDLQQEDGSWAQLPDAKGDAYATATVLMALRRSGLKADHAAYRKGVAYLVKTQTEEGAWLVTTRSRPIQTFFDNGDPGGKNQFISFAATGWAVQALLECVPRR